MVEQVFWSQAQLRAGIQQLAQQLGGEALAGVPAGAPDLEHLAYEQGLEAVATHSTYGDLAQTLQKLVPGILAINYKGESGYLLVNARRGQVLYLLTPTGGQQSCPIEQLIEWLRADRGLQADPSLEPLLDTLGLQGRRLQQARRLLLQQQLEQSPIRGLWLLRPHPSRGLLPAARHARLGRYALGFMLAHLAGRLTLIASVGLLGYALTQGLWTVPIILTWLMLMLSYWWLGGLGQAQQLQLNVRAGVIIKRQLQYSALYLPPEALATKGPAQLLGQALETEGLHNNALSGLFTAINSLLDIGIALVIALLLQQWLISLLVLVFVLASSYPIIQFVRSYAVWARQRVRLSHLTIEHMQGNRTRLMQSGPDRWHKEEERQLQRYWLASRRMDKYALWLQAIIPALWLISGCLLLCVAIFFNRAPLVELAGLLGVILLVWQAWHGIADSSQQLARSWYSWQQVLSLLAQSKPAQLVACERGSTQAGQHVAQLEASQLSFGYTSSSPIIRNLDLHLEQGRHYLLQGESGSGKSTLLGLLAGQINQQYGWLLFNDRDLATLGQQYWRKKICWVPQYHDNHIFSGSLLYNLLLGRTWPPTEEDTELALDVCEQLGLFPLLRKMPAKVLQPVGEMGWQLSQGEASRVYLARALLQNPDFLLLDESLGALDANTSLQILTHLQNGRTATLLCMHP
jgi:ATP-binding cassette subfamily B protein